MVLISGWDGVGFFADASDKGGSVFQGHEEIGVPKLLESYKKDN